MQEADLVYNSSKIHYRFSRGGSKLLICWHGYDESSGAFEVLLQEMKDFSFLCIDLPYHGGTDWKEPGPITADELAGILHQIKTKEFPEFLSYSMLGFSLGGRLALSFFQTTGNPIDNLVLLAPDGINTNFWHWFSTRTWVGNRIFRFSVSNPGWIFGFLKLGNRLRLINQSVYKFTRFYLQDQKSRELLYKRWTCMRRINPDRTSIKEAVRKHGIKLHLVYGEYDRIIKHEKASEFSRDLGAQCELHILSCGHQVLHEKNAAFIASLFRDS